MDIVDLMQKALDTTNDHDALFALDKGITEIERLREQLKYSNEFREIMNEERCDALEENERLREALKQAQCNCEEPCLHGRWCSSWIARAALKERE